MPAIDNRIIEALRRQQLVTEYIIYPFSDITDYQINLTNVPSFSKEDVLVVSNKMILPHWVESKGSVWIKIPKLTKNTPLKIYTLTGNPSAASASNGTNTFVFFDDFSGDLSKWTVTQSTAGNVAIVAGEVQLTGIAAWASNGMTSIVNISRPVIIEWKSRTSGTGIESFEGYSVQPLNYATGLSFLRGNELLRILDNAYITLEATWSSTQSTWKIDLPSVGYKIYRNNVLKETNTAWATNNNKIAFQINKVGQYQYIDNVIVRKYASPEPIVQKVRTLNKSLLIKELMR